MISRAKCYYRQVVSVISENEAKYNWYKFPCVSMIKFFEDFEKMIGFQKSFRPSLSKNLHFHFKPLQNVSFLSYFLKLGSHIKFVFNFICFNEKYFKNDKRWFLFHVKSSFLSKDIFIFVLTCRKVM